MGSNITETKTVDYEAMAEQAELEAESDAVASAGRKVPEDITTSGEDEKDEDEDEGNKFKAELFKEYEFNDGTETRKIKTLDLSGLIDLTTVDAERFDRILIKSGHRPPNKFTDTTYCKHIAVYVTNLPIEFFNALNMRDMLLIMGIIHNYFLFG